MALSFKTPANKVSTFAYTITQEYTISTDSDRVLLACFTHARTAPNGSNAIAPTFSGSPMTNLYKSGASVGTEFSVWYMINPPASLTANVYAAVAVNSDKWALIVQEVSGVNQTTPFKTVYSSTSAGATSRSVTVLDFAAGETAYMWAGAFTTDASATDGADQTRQGGAFGQWLGVSSTKTANGSLSESWTTSVACAGVAFVIQSAAPLVTLMETGKLQPMWFM